MSEIKDDPREVLVLLNSLGFVGITAGQLKAFMKDLKTYRKVKEHERQQRREEIKARIINKQQALIRKAYGDKKTKCSSRGNIIHSESSNSLDDESLLEIKIRCIPPNDQNVEIEKRSKISTVKSSSKLIATQHQKPDQSPKSIVKHFEQDHLNAKRYPSIRRTKSDSKQDLLKSSEIDIPLTEKRVYNIREQQGEHYKSANSRMQEHHPVNEPALLEYVNKPRSKSVTLDPIGHVRTQSSLSARSSVNSKHKSFIRPWRLQPEAQKNVINKKCDPVTLYQKYQQEWKHISFPGEATHSKLRWAVRERMLGTDPHPAPLSRKSPILKRK